MEKDIPYLYQSKEAKLDYESQMKLLLEQGKT